MRTHPTTREKIKSVRRPARSFSGRHIRGPANLRTGWS